MSADPPSASDPGEALLAEALRRGYLSQAQLDAARREEQGLRAAGRSPGLLPLLAQRILRPEQVAALRSARLDDSAERPTVAREVLDSAELATTEGPALALEGPTPAGGSAAQAFALPRPAGLPLGTRIGGVVLRRVLGQGGMGVVYLGEEASGGARCAVKLLSLEAQPRRLERFRREGQAQAAVDAHPNVVRVHSAGEAHGHSYLVMDLAEGGDLADRLAAGALPWEEALALGAALARGLAHVHARGILHRDLKPANVLFDGTGRPQLVDFGLALVEGAETLTATGTMLGTPAYMAPEQARGERKRVDARTDVYGLGALLYHALSGVTPFQGASLHSVLRQVMSEAPLPPSRHVPQLPARVDRVVLRALAKEPADRYPTAKALAEALEALGRGEAPEGARVARFGAVLCVLALLAGGLGWGLTRPDAEETRLETATPSDSPAAARQLWELRAGDLLRLRVERVERRAGVVRRVVVSLDQRMSGFSGNRMRLVSTLVVDELAHSDGPDEGTAQLSASQRATRAETLLRFDLEPASGAVSALRVAETLPQRLAQALPQAAPPGARELVPAACDPQAWAAILNLVYARGPAATGAERRRQRGTALVLPPLDPGRSRAASGPVRVEESSAEAEGWRRLEFIQTFEATPERAVQDELRVDLRRVPIGADLAPIPHAAGAVRNTRDGTVFLELPPGRFVAGGRDPQLIPAALHAPREVAIPRPFYLAKHEVSWAQYRRFCRETGREPPTNLAGHPGHVPFEAPDDHPVFHVSWDEAQAYCAWAGGRLPTNDEWEWAARGDDGRRYPWGDLIGHGSAGANLKLDDGYAYTSPVGSFAAGVSPWGVFDMAGNVAEWVVEPFGASASLDGRAAPPAAKTIRGSAWDDSFTRALVALRRPLAPEQRLAWVGFRLCRDVE